MKLILLITFIAHSLNAANLEDYLFSKKSERNTLSLIIIKNDNIIFDRSIVDKKQKYLLWSMSKSITSLLIGVAQDKGLLNINDSISKYLTSEIPQENLKTISMIKIKDLLQMSSGIDWNEIYDASPFKSHVVNMLYNSDIKSMGAYPLTLETSYSPGVKFNYSSGDTNVLNLILKKIVKKSEQDTYPWKWLFDPLGIKSASFEQDQSGTFVGSSYVYLNAGDLIKIGKLILNKGIYNNQRIISSSYLKEATSISKEHLEYDCLKSSKRTYGFQFWLNSPCKDGRIPFKGIDEDIVMMLGYAGQNLIIFPSRNAIVLRFANDKHGALSLETYLKIIQEKLDEK